MPERSSGSHSSSRRGTQTLKAASSEEVHDSPASGEFTTGAVRRYALFEEFASGGIATVHFGRLLGPSGFARTVAIKRLRPQYARDVDFLSMFLDEAHLSARVRHPNVVSTLDIVATDGELLVVMEYVAGESLANLLRTLRGQDDRVPLPIAAAVLVGVLHGLHAAHEACDASGAPLGIVHRDVSPHNILVGTDGTAQVIDFGVARARGRAQVTQVGEVKGKLGYMPPEQLFSEPLDRRADVFAASVVFWEALTGRRLYPRANELQPFARFAGDQELEPPSRYAPDLPPEIDRIVLSGLARAPSDRFATARDMALAVEGATALATASRVGGWVEALAREALEERTAAIARTEGRDSAMQGAAIYETGRSQPVSDGSAPVSDGAAPSGRHETTGPKTRPAALALEDVSELAGGSPSQRIPFSRAPRRALVFGIFALSAGAVVAAVRGGAAGALGPATSARSPAVQESALALPPPAPSPPANDPAAYDPVGPAAAGSASPEQSASLAPAPPLASVAPFARVPTPASGPLAAPRPVRQHKASKAVGRDEVL
jgi:serine/threonine-protein kinase